MSIGASDLDAEVFSYDDLPAGQTDPDLQHFSITKDAGIATSNQRTVTFNAIFVY